MRRGGGGRRVRTTEERGGCVAQANGEVDASDGVGEQGGLRGRRGSLGSPIRYQCRRRTPRSRTSDVEKAGSEAYAHVAHQGSSQRRVTSHWNRVRHHGRFVRQ